MVTSDVAQQIQGTIVLHPLGDDVEPEHVSKFDRRTDEVGVFDVAPSRAA